MFWLNPHYLHYYSYATIFQCWDELYGYFLSCVLFKNLGLMTSSFLYLFNFLYVTCVFSTDLDLSVSFSRCLALLTSSWNPIVSTSNFALQSCCFVTVSGLSFATLKHCFLCFLSLSSLKLFSFNFSIIVDIQYCVSFRCSA